MTTELRIAALALMVASTGCMAHHAAEATAPSPGARAAPRAMAGHCPMEVPGTQVSAADTQDGEAVTFITSPDHEADLRSRVHAMADMHNGRHQGGGTDHGGMHGGMHGSGSMGSDTSTGSGAMGHMEMMPPPSRASVQDVPGGARLIVTPSDPGDRERLQSVVRMHAQHMSETHACGMDEHGGM
jgi:hypothetical protein